MVSANYHIASLSERSGQKQASRDHDVERVRIGAATPQQIRRENHVLGGVDVTSFRMVSIGKRRIGSN